MSGPFYTREEEELRCSSTREEEELRCSSTREKSNLGPFYTRERSNLGPFYTRERRRNPGYLPAERGGILVILRVTTSGVQDPLLPLFTLKTRQIPSRFCQIPDYSRINV